GVSYTLQDKIATIKLLDEMGIDFIEAGNPFSNPKDAMLYESLENIKLKHSKIVAFGSTRRKNIEAKDDKNLLAILKAKTEFCAIFGKSSVFQVEKILETSLSENLLMIEESCRFLSENGKKVIFDAEHFFDGYKENKDYALKALDFAVKGGAIELCLCDTKGATMPLEVREIISELVEKYETPITVHFHDDCGMAVANSLIAVQCGAVGVQGTFLGIGERCGNANLSVLIPSLQVKNSYECIPQENMKNLTSIVREIASLNNIDLKSDMPYVGENAFSHKAGMHGAGVLKNSFAFEHIDPEIVGNERRFPGSEMSGKAVVFEKIKKFAPDIDIHSQETENVLAEIKRLEHLGYQFEGADASFCLLVLKRQNKIKKIFELINYKINIHSNEEHESRATAVVKIAVGDKVQLMAAEGNGPVNALDKAIRKALEIHFPRLKEVKLTDYKVRVLDTKSATASVVRVLVTSTDGKDYFTTVGVSEDVVDASWKAIEDSIEFILNKWQ
ncbi:MAG: citramalate synthase, partial [Clostridia bacterium]